MEIKNLIFCFVPLFLKGTVNMAGESALEIVLESLFTHYYLCQNCVQHSEFVKPYSRGKYCLTFLLSSVYHLVRKWLSIVKFLIFISIVH